MREEDRKRMRLRDFDYTSEGAYFLTLCLQKKLSLFENHRAKEMVEKWIVEIENKYENVTVDCYVVMEDHVHLILFITEGNQISLSEIMKWFKTMTTNEYIRGVRDRVYEPFEKKLWQRSFYDHIIRNDEDLKEKREYVMNNPAKKRERSTFLKI